VLVEKTVEGEGFDHRERVRRQTDRARTGAAAQRGAAQARVATFHRVRARPANAPGQRRIGQARPGPGVRDYAADSIGFSSRLSMNRPTPDPALEGSKHLSESRPIPSWEGLGVGSWSPCLRRSERRLSMNRSPYHQVLE